MDQKWLEDLNLFTTIALSDVALFEVREHQFPLLYLFSETDDNRSSSLSMATRLYQNRIADCIAMADNSQNPGYSGFREWLNDLYIGMIPKLPKQADVVPIDVPGNLNTFSESQAMMRYTQEHGIRTVGAVAPSFHMPRAFLSAISVSVRECPDIKIYALPGWIPDWWHENVAHSQGTTRGTRAALVASERERIRRYQQKGDLISFDQAFDYLAKRDQ